MPPSPVVFVVVLPPIPFAAALPEPPCPSLSPSSLRGALQDAESAITRAEPVAASAVNEVKWSVRMVNLGGIVSATAYVRQTSPSCRPFRLRCRSDVG